MQEKRGLVQIALPVFLLLSATGFSGRELVRQFTTIQQTATKKTVSAQPQETTTSTPLSTETIQSVTAHVALPQEVRGIYWTAATVRIKRAEELRTYIKTTGLNTVVIDLKMDNGQIAIPPQEIINNLGKDNMYRIARIAVMRDSVYAYAHPTQAIKSASGKIWVDKTGIAWLNPSHPEIAEAAISLGRQAYAMGFDEIQYDYVRFATDGAIAAIAKSDNPKTKSEIMRAFFEKVGGTLKAEHIPVSFDVFGMTFITAADVGTGQRLEDVYPNADFISPMVYPSHYWPGFQGYNNPALYPYEVVKYSLDKGAEILETDQAISATSSRPHFRPWLQDFDIGAVYTAARIEAQIKASRDAGASGWILWNARNVYEPANYAPLTEKKTTD